MASIDDITKIERLLQELKKKDEVEKTDKLNTSEFLDDREA